MRFINIVRHDSLPRSRSEFDTVDQISSQATGLQRGRPLLSVLAWLARQAALLILRSHRWQIIGAEHREHAFMSKERLLLAIWHGQVMVAPALVPKGGRRITALASRSKDGEFAARVMAPLGFDFARGSTRNPLTNRDKGGREAAAVMVEAIRGGALGAITPDGPRGPRQRCQMGVARIAMDAEAAVVPVAASCSHARNLASWDRFLLIWPFGRIVVIFGEPMRPATDESAEAFRQRIETTMNALTAQADALTGRVSIEPGEALA